MGWRGLIVTRNLERRWKCCRNPKKTQGLQVKKRCKIDNDKKVTWLLFVETLHIETWGYSLKSTDDLFFPIYSYLPILLSYLFITPCNGANNVIVVFTHSRDIILLTMHVCAHTYTMTHIYILCILSICIKIKYII